MNFRQKEKIMWNYMNSRVACIKRLGQLWLPAILIGLLCGVAIQAQTPRGETQFGKRDNITEGFVLIEGDIQVPAQHVFNGRFQPNAAYRLLLWDNGIVPFVFSFNVSMANQALMLDAMAEWEAIANVDFRPRNGESNFVFIQDSSSDNSAIGMVGGEQIINIKSWDETFVMAHELGHCLGLRHEHTRIDRDLFVQINTGNIQYKKEDQFDLNIYTHIYGPYDFDSVMHYSKCAFANICLPLTNCECAPGLETITVLPPNDIEWQDKIGQRDHLSYLDGVVMSSLYPFSNMRFVNGNYNGALEVGTFHQPFKTFVLGALFVPPNGTVIVQPGSYAAGGVYDKPMTIKAPLNGVSLGN